MSAEQRYYTAPDGVRLAYDVVGEGPAVLLLHGFGSDGHINWFRPHIVDAVVAAGASAVVYDARGHGRSDKPYRRESYSGQVMVDDARGLLDHLGIGSVDVVGYSMGAHTASLLVPGERRARSCVLGGIGSALLLHRPGAGRYPAEEIARALEADDPSTITQDTPRAFRSFVDATKGDRRALAALQYARSMDRYPDLGAIVVPTLVMVGERDTLVGDPAAVVAAIAGARLQIVPGDHLSAVVSPEFAQSLVSFLGSL